MKYGYDPETYASLPTVAQSGASFLQKEAEKAMSDIGRLYVNHSMQQTHGLALLHRHHKLSPEEFMVEYRGTATAWPIDTHLPDGAVIRPTTWAITEGAMKPYEFEFIPGSESHGRGDSDEDVVVDPKFVQELHDLLEEKDLLSTFGCVKLRTGEAAMQDAYEITVGRSSVTFPRGDIIKGVGAMWRFEDDETGVQARVCGSCFEYGTCL